MKILILLILSLSMICTGCKKEEDMTDMVGKMEETEVSETKEETDMMKEIYSMSMWGTWGEGSAENRETEEWGYTVYQKDGVGAVVVYLYKGLDRNIVVPDSLDGYPVIGVVDPKMKVIMKDDEYLRTFTYSYEMKEITGIEFPDTVYFTDGMFNSTAWYENQPDGEVYINNVFYNYKGEMPEGTVIELKEGTLGLCHYSFLRCKGLEKVIMPDSVLWLDNGVFSDCISLNEIRFSKNLMGMGMEIFSEAKSLTEIYLPTSLEDTHFKCFDNSNIQTIYFEGRKPSAEGINLAIKLGECEYQEEVPLPY